MLGDRVVLPGFQRDINVLAVLVRNRYRYFRWFTVVLLVNTLEDNVNCFFGWRWRVSLFVNQLITWDSVD